VNAMIVDGYSVAGLLVHIMHFPTAMIVHDYSVADLLVLVICCPNGMIEMFMRRVRTNEFVSFPQSL
jgi:hypothetical protein